MVGGCLARVERVVLGRVGWDRTGEGGVEVEGWGGGVGLHALQTVQMLWLRFGW